MKLILKYDGGLNEDTDHILTTMVEYMMVESEFVGCGFDMTTSIRDLQFDVTLPKHIEEKEEE